MRPDIWSAMARHQRVAFQFSGGKDSTAALYVMRPFWDRLTVYHVDPGEQFPELGEVVRAVGADTGLTIHVIRSDVAAWRRQHGVPSDLVPFDHTDTGRLLSGKVLPIVSRLECCAANVMAPMHRRMLEDGMTLLVRGTRLDEFKGGMPMRSGESDGQVELLHPIEHWTAQEVLNYLTEQGLPVAPFYSEGMKAAPECMRCTAWWDDGRMAYLRRHHPAAAESYAVDLRMLHAHINGQLESLEKEIAHG